MGKTATRSLLTASAVGSLAVGALLILFSTQALLSKSIHEADLMLKVNMSYRGNNSDLTVEDPFLIALLFGLISVAAASCGLIGLVMQHRVCLRVFILLAPLLAVCYILAGVGLLSMMVTLVPTIQSEVTDTCKASSYPALMKEVGCDMPDGDTGNVALLQTGVSNPNCRVILTVGPPYARVYTSDVDTAEIHPVHGHHDKHYAQPLFDDSPNATLSKGLVFALASAWQTCTGGNASASNPTLNAYGVGELRNKLPEEQTKLWAELNKLLKRGLYDGHRKFNVDTTETLSAGKEAFNAFVAANIDAGMILPNLKKDESAIKKNAYSGAIYLGSHALAVTFAMKGNEHESTHSNLHALANVTDNVFAHSYKNFGYEQFFSADAGASLAEACAGGSTDCIIKMRTVVDKVAKSCPEKECTPQSCTCPSKIHVPAAVRQFYLVGTEFYSLWRTALQITGWNEDIVSLENLATIATDVCAYTPEDALSAVCGTYIPFIHSGTACRENIEQVVNSLCRNMAYIAVSLEVVFKATGKLPFHFVVKPTVLWENAASMIESNGEQYDGPKLIDVSTFTAADLERKVYFHDVGPGLCLKQFSDEEVTKVDIDENIGESNCRRTCEDFRLCWAYSTNMLDQCRLYLEPVTRSSGVAADWFTTKCSLVHTIDPRKLGDREYYEDLGDGSCLDADGHKVESVPGGHLGDRACRMKCKGKSWCTGVNVATKGNSALCKLHKGALVRGNGDLKDGVCVAFHRVHHVVEVTVAAEGEHPTLVHVVDKFEIPQSLTQKSNTSEKASTSSSKSTGKWALASWKQWFMGGKKTKSKVTKKTSEPTQKAAQPAAETTEKSATETIEKSAVGTDKTGTEEKPVVKPAEVYMAKTTKSTVEQRKVNRRRLVERELELTHFDERELEGTKAVAPHSSCGALCKRRAAAFDILGPAKCNFLVNLCSSLNEMNVGQGQCVTKDHQPPGTTYESAGKLTAETCKEKCFHDVWCRGFEFFTDTAVCRVISPTQPIGPNDVTWSQAVKKPVFEPIVGSDGSEGVHCYRPGTFRVMTRFTFLGHISAYTVIVLGSLLLVAFSLGWCYLLEITKGRKRRQEPVCRRICCPWSRTYEKVDKGTVLLRRDSDEDLASDFEDDDSDCAAE